MATSAQRYFEPAPASISQARSFAAAVLVAWGMTHLADHVQLCVSEVASNALVHGTLPGHGFLVRLAADDGFVRVEVHDSRRRRPRACLPTDLEVSGRGLLIVDELADDWGARDREPLGKVVWLRFKAESVDSATASSC